MAKRFFPRNVFAENDEEDDQVHRMYAGNLIMMREKPIFNLNSSDLTIYRCLYLRSFHIPVMVKVTVEKNENNLKAIIQEEGRRNREKEVNKTLTEKEIHEIEKYIKKLNFWNMSTSHARSPFTFDQSQGILEVYDKSKKYHIMERHPGRNNNFFAIIDYLLDLADPNTRKIRS